MLPAALCCGGSRAMVGVGRALSVMNSSGEKGKVVVITGPTGVGKSSAAIALAKRVGGEIISADSVQLYKRLDVGSAKTPLAERQGVPHHLLDLIEPTEEYSVGDFFRHAREATDAVLARGKVPIVVGGTGLYLLWYINGRPNTPKASEAQAAAVDAEVESIISKGGGWDDAVRHLIQAGDPATARALARNDWYRLRRALEILKASGKPRGSFPLPWSTGTPVAAAAEFPGTPQLDDDAELLVGLSKEEGEDSAVAAAATQSRSQSRMQTRTTNVVPSARVLRRDSDYDFRCFFMHMRRTELYRRLDLRCEQMLAGPPQDGMLQEASWLLDLGVVPNSSSPSRAIGYRQAMEYLTTCRSPAVAAGGGGGEERDASGSSASEFLDFLWKFQKASRNYAKRQLTWFRDEENFRWVDASLPTEEIVRGMEAEYRRSPFDSTGPSSWEIEQKATEIRDVKALKTYVTENKIFLDSASCSGILDWVQRTQHPCS